MGAIKPSSKKTWLRSWFKKVVLPLPRSFGRPARETSGVSVPRLAGVAHGSRGPVVAWGTGQGPGEEMQEAVTCGAGQVALPLQCHGLGLRGQWGRPGWGAPMGTSARPALGPLPHRERRALRSGLVTAVARWLPVAGCEVHGGLEPQHLPLHQPGVEAALGQQLLVCALLHHAALVEHHDEVRPLHRAQPVRDDEHRVFLQIAVDGLLDLRTQEGTGSQGRCRRPPHHPVLAQIPGPPHPMDVQPLWGFFFFWGFKRGLAQDLLPEFLSLGDRAQSLTWGSTR